MTECQTTKIPREWEGRGEMTIPITSGQFTGGATRKKDQPELPTDGRLFVKDFLSSTIARIANDLPRLWLSGGTQNVP
jgi:hypothetical protein